MGKNDYGEWRINDGLRIARVTQGKTDCVGSLCAVLFWRDLFTRPQSVFYWRDGTTRSLLGSARLARGIILARSQSEPIAEKKYVHNYDRQASEDVGVLIHS